MLLPPPPTGPMNYLTLLPILNPFAGQPPEVIAAGIIELYQSYGDAQYSGEPVSQTQHMIQCAMAARSAGAGKELELAAFLHDIGHLCEHLMPVEHMDEWGVVHHEGLGASWLKSMGFSDRLVQLVASHVDAKRYLTYRNPEYFFRLSDASKSTLAFQGGPMTAREAAAFEADPLFDDYILLRRCDEAAKVPDANGFPLQYYHELIVQHLASQTC